MARTKVTRVIQHKKTPSPPVIAKPLKKSAGEKLWEAERPMLRNVALSKGFKINPYPKGRKRPAKSFEGLLNVLQSADYKKPAPGHVRRWRSTHEHNKSFVVSDPHASKKFFSHPMKK